MGSKKGSKSENGATTLEVFRSGGGEGDYLSRWKRLVEIDRLLRDGSFPTAKKLATHCGVSTKTIYRDIDALRLELDAPIEFSRSKRGYHYTHKRFALPAVTLSDRDLFALLVAENAVEQYVGTPLHSHLREAFERVLSYLPGELRDQHELAARAVHFGGLPPALMRPGIWSELCVAIYKRETVQLTYRLPKTGTIVERLIHPLLLVVRDREWFAVAFLPKVEHTPLYYLPRVVNVERLTETFEPPVGFSAESYYSEGFNSMRGLPNAKKVVLRYKPECAHLADERAWANTQKITHHRDGSASVTFRTTALFAVKREVLQYGGNIEVKSPPELRELMKAAGEQIIAEHCDV
ncbi:MAG: putative DNA-binding transcriptional regulator YafY [Planctomycetota bacterium]|jgi:predicted DNA-binding transcriptional regulator YafY